MELTESKYWNIIVLLLLAVVTFTFCFPLIASWHKAGEYDWDYGFFAHEVPRKTIVEYGQFPLWNPYYAGGLSTIGNPQTRYLSPSIIYSLLFGTIIGLKLEIFTHIFTGLVGMYLLARQLKMGRLSSFVPAFVFTLNSYFVLHISEGHTTFFAPVYIPFIFLFFLKSLDDNKKYLFLTSIFIALIVFEGGALHFAPFLLFFGSYSIFSSIGRKNIKPFFMMLVSVFFAVLYCAPKLLPSLEIARAFQRFTGLEKPLALKVLYHIFLNPDQHLHSQGFLNLQWPWCEYGAYIGPLVLLAFLASFILCPGVFNSLFRRAGPAGGEEPGLSGNGASTPILCTGANRLFDPFLISGTLFLIIGMGDFSNLSPWHLLHKLPIFNYMHILSRFFILFVFAVALRAGMTFDYFEKKFVRYRFLTGAGILLVLFNLLYVNSGTFKEAFTLDVNFVKEDKPFVQKMFKKEDYYGAFSTMYPMALKNMGLLDCYEPINVTVYAVPSDSPRYRGEYYLYFGNGNVNMTYWSPNRMVYKADLKNKDILVINQNYEKNWKTKPFLKIRPQEGLLAVDVGPVNEKIEFYYMPESFKTGIYLLVFGLVLSFSFILLKTGPARENI